AAALHEARASRLVLASFELTGFEEIGRLRLALPRALLGSEAPAAGARSEPDVEARRALACGVLDTPVRVSVAAGTERIRSARVGIARISLARMAALKVGDGLPVTARRDGAVVVGVEGVARFCGVRGAQNGRVAVQIVDRLEAGEEAADGRVAAELGEREEG